MTTIEVSGLPIKSKLTKLVFIFKNTLKKAGASTKFWIKEMADIRGTNTSYVTIEFGTYDEAYKASKVLDGFVYFGDRETGDMYPLKARVNEHSRSMMKRRRSPSPFMYRSPSPYRRRSPSPYRHMRDDQYYDDPWESRRRSRDHSRSRTDIHREASKLDIEIEMLRKRRLIMEEERRLLLERKKLELLKEFGPSALRELKYLDDDHSPDRKRERRFRRSRSPVYRRRPSPPRRGPQPRPLKPNKQTVKRDATNKLPPFIYPCKVLLNEMKEIMEKLATKEENVLLLRVTRNNIRKRLAILLTNKPIMAGDKVVKLYREKYHQTRDEDFIKSNLKEVRSSHMLLDKTTELNEENDQSLKTEENSEAKNNEDTDAKPDTSESVTETEPNASVDDPVCTDDPIVKGENYENEQPKEVDNSEITNENEPKNDDDELNIENKEKQYVDNEASTKDLNPKPKEGKEDGGSITSSDALTLHDKNDEDWVASTKDVNPKPNEGKEDVGSITSSDALTLHDKNDEDWVEGENLWTEE